MGRIPRHFSLPRRVKLRISGKAIAEHPAVIRVPEGMISAPEVFGAGEDNPRDTRRFLRELLWIRAGTVDQGGFDRLVPLRGMTAGELSFLL